MRGSAGGATITADSGGHGCSRGTHLALPRGDFGNLPGRIVVVSARTGPATVHRHGGGPEGRRGLFDRDAEGTVVGVGLACRLFGRGPRPVLTDLREGRGCGCVEGGGTWFPSPLVWG
ncbi:hypothetical protein GCM10010343_07380 [Streptomyces avidinii]|nr:hypothetical protein GCM10010343_07380 [Streptomyces avidinii]